MPRQPSTSVAPHVAALTRGTTAAQRSKAAASLASLAADDVEHRAAMVRAGCVAPLVRLLSTGSAAGKEHAAAALAELAASSAELAHANVIAPLVALVSVGTEEQKENAARALSRLATSLDDAPAGIVEAGGIAPLVALVGMGTAVQKTHAAAALARLAYRSPERCAAIVSAGGVAPLLALGSDGTADEREKAALALSRLTMQSAVSAAAVERERRDRNARCGTEPSECRARSQTQPGELPPPPSANAHPLRCRSDSADAARRARRPTAEGVARPSTEALLDFLRTEFPHAPTGAATALVAHLSRILGAPPARANLKEQLAHYCTQLGMQSTGGGESDGGTSQPWSLPSGRVGGPHARANRPPLGGSSDSSWSDGDECESAAAYAHAHAVRRKGPGASEAERALDCEARACAAQAAEARQQEVRLQRRGRCVLPRRGRASQHGVSMGALTRPATATAVTRGASDGALGGRVARREHEQWIADIRS